MFAPQGKEKPKVEVNEKGRPIRKSAKKKVNYKLMMASDSDSAPLKPTEKAIEKDEEDLAAWIQAVNEASALRDT